PVDLVPDEPRPELVSGGVPRALLTLPVLALAAAALYTAWGPLGERRDAHASGTNRGEFAWMRPVEKRAIRDLRPGSVVLADIHLRTSYRVMALAPVYVVGAPAGHVAN